MNKIKIIHYFIKMSQFALSYCFNEHFLNLRALSPAATAFLSSKKTFLVKFRGEIYRRNGAVKQ